MKNKKVPMRTCVGCREVKSKRELVRIVRRPTGEVMLDPGGRSSGRGAYVCPDEGCLEKATKKKSLSYTLNIEINETDSTRLKKEIGEFISNLKKEKQMSD